MKKLNKKGFTLTEILVAVSIVAVLSAISVPSYRRMKASAKTTEAKTNLGQLYIAEKSFFIQWGCYISDLITIGFRPEGELLYNVGFNQSTPDVTGGVVPSGHPCSNYSGPDITGSNNNLYTICGQKIGAPTDPKLQNCGFVYKGIGFQSPNIPASSATPPDGSVLDIATSSTKFTAVAIANIHDLFSTDLTKTGKNIWTINNFKQIVEIQDIDGN